MKNQEPTQAEWAKLFALAARVKELAPWEWMYEDDVFGVHDDDAGVTGFVSVMGAGGEHFAVALYLDPAALYAFLDMKAEGMEEADEDEDEFELDPNAALRVLELPQVQVAFEDNSNLEKEDKALIKRLGLKFRGAKAWPQFRSYAPGLLPWHLTKAEVRRLTVALEQLLQVAPRYRDDLALLTPSPDEEVFLVRAHGEKGWEDRIEKIDEVPAMPLLTMDVGAAELAQAKALPRVTNVLEIDLLMMPLPVQEKKSERPFFPYLLMMAEAQSGALVGNEMLQPLPSLEAMYQRVPSQVLEVFARLGVLPERMRMRNPVLLELLVPLAKELDFVVEPTLSLPGVDGAMNFLGQMMPMF